MLPSLGYRGQSLGWSSGSLVPEVMFLDTNLPDSPSCPRSVITAGYGMDRETHTRRRRPATTHNGTPAQPRLKLKRMPASTALGPVLGSRPPSHPPLRSLWTCLTSANTLNLQVLKMTFLIYCMFHLRSAGALMESGAIPPTPPSTILHYASVGHSNVFR